VLPPSTTAAPLLPKLESGEPFERYLATITLRSPTTRLATHPPARNFPFANKTSELIFESEFGLFPIIKFVYIKPPEPKLLSGVPSGKRQTSAKSLVEQLAIILPSGKVITALAGRLPKMWLIRTFPFLPKLLSKVPGTCEKEIKEITDK